MISYTGNRVELHVLQNDTCLLLNTGLRYYIAEALSILSWYRNIMLNDLKRNPAIKNWASLLHNLLLSMRFNDVWSKQGVGNYNNFISVFKQRLSDVFIQNWHSRIETVVKSSVLYVFCNFPISTLS